MIKTFCDACGKEIKKGDEAASIVSVEKQHVLPSTMGADKNSVSTLQPVQVTRLACGKCFGKVKKIFK